MNIDHMNILINTIEKAKPEQCIMGRWKKPLGCGTAYCIGGWIDHLICTDAIPSVIYKDLDRYMHHSYQDQTAAVLEIPDDQAYYLTKPGIMDTFDLLDASTRKAAMLKVLRWYRDEGTIQWRRAVDEAYSAK